jgi:tetratricopeptide (TPR) repeat protein
MRAYLNRFLGVALAGSMLSLAACDDFLEVKNPNSLEAEAVDPERDARLLSLSAYQGFVAAHGDIAVYGAWFANEARVGDTFPTRNEFGRRDVPNNNTHIAGELWNTQHRAMQFARTTISSIEAAGNNIDLARAYFTAGWTIMNIGLHFCEGTIAESWLVARGPITSAAMLDSAIVYLQKANDIARGLNTTEGTNMANAAMVGIAQSHLQNGRKAQAAAAAGAAIASNPSFSYVLPHFDDANNRGRLGNTIWSYSESRISLVVGPEWRAMADAGDPRIAYVDMKRPSQDGELNFFRQNKITGWGSADRLASALEARYIIEEANMNPVTMLAFINERRAVGKQTPFASADPQVLLRELMEQKGRDFWLEGKRMADFRRLGHVVPYVLETGPNYYKNVQGGVVGNQNCWPVPQGEINNNPEWPKG